MDADVSDLRQSGLNMKWSVANCFAKVGQTNYWVYCHSGHIACNTVLFDNFKSCMDVTMDDSSYGECGSCSHCHILEPYFSDNFMLEKSWDQGGHTDLVQELKQAMEVNIGLDEGIFASQGCVTSSGNEWIENTWTKRLVGALERHLPNHKVKYTAELGRTFATTQAPLSGLSTDGRILRCYYSMAAVTVQ